MHGPPMSHLDYAEATEEITHELVRSRGKMRIEFAPPPNIDAIEKVFPGVRKDCYVKGIFFAWGNTIFNPSRRPMPLEILAHEACHSIQHEQQFGPEAWWDQYLADKRFRFEQELQAHRIEYQDVLFQGGSRTLRRLQLASISERLAGPLYGKMTTKAKAKEMIRG
jgi:hypothetical protein